ncbi:unnamed protein product [Prorocentrum cordatum]|uniref:RAP domain-containing protein n=1 Tax=Prorocentrum cordatum TaxID=2364126 RepID=A0ABN9UP32_9DINO|nr:unnamed protein product [Polarella glacialis]
MDAQYITACVQKAAALRKHDVQLWKRYSARILELKEDLLPEQLGYILWGYGKSSFVDAHFFSEITPTVQERLPQFQSHALMSLMWCMKKVKWKDRTLVEAAARHSLDVVDALRPSDFIKVANAAAALGLKDPGLREAMSKVAVPKLEETFAQQFRDAVNPAAIGCLWSDAVVEYLLERFRRIFITARPQHLMKAYESAVVCRVLQPQVWRSLSNEARQFYVRLSQRHIPDKGREPTALHWDVSRHLADLGEAHRNAFRWGPFNIDIGLEELEADERRRCLMVDAPTAFFHGTDQYFPTRHLQHRVLTSLGWDVRRVRWDDWAELGPSGDGKKAPSPGAPRGSRRAPSCFPGAVVRLVLVHVPFFFCPAPVWRLGRPGPLARRAGSSTRSVPTGPGDAPRPNGTAFQQGLASGAAPGGARHGGVQKRGRLFRAIID